MPTIAPDDPERSEPVAQLDALGIVARDLARSLAFYRLLGLQFPEGAEDEPHVEAHTGTGVRVMIDPLETIRSFDPDFTAPGNGSPGTSLAFRCDSPAEVDATYDAVVGAGFDGHRPPWDAFWGQRYAQVRDPDGNGVDLYAALPGS
jgi:catechol 2,3-dioxygenase-like lactoylglutathione lyase family enzyme